ncbi:FAD-dependent oxidoreductase [Vibrio sp. Of7-15]|uniref:NAD(P)/FAD-dependent oxidoreductase n=1 Tax=Vibrio sp. Of7-15 TaxID=2724879 RepID=UPI001EF31814|nr:FAD-dependent oxidoreductase [Vibrio sp. Of7-15]MCG7497869.1 FAD-dependent oxidoreductase [Vibrio sp. Of7-15]
MKKIAIIGSGISGLTCAYLLDEKHDVTVFEKNDYVGGHTATVDINYGGKEHAIDTGFIVFNDRTYPNFNRLLSRLGIERRDTEMSFSVHNRHTQFEYNGHSINSLFAQRRNLIKPRFWKLIVEIVKFNELCKDLFIKEAIPEGAKLGDFLERHRFSDFFRQHYILPMGAAIWSTSLLKMAQFELKFFIQFFYHHGLLNIVDRPQWYVVPGGSRSYVEAIQTTLSNAIVTSASIEQVNRANGGVDVVMTNGEVRRFDEVIFACHSDQALGLLANPTELETQVLSAIPYSGNEVVLHTDTSLLPDRQRAWASWNYRLDGDASRPACVTYNMNILQHINDEHTFCVTLNQTEAIDPDKVIRSFVYHHPVLDESSVKAQQQRSLICGQNNCHFVGAYWYNGFHEDGVRSALDVTQRFGVSL